MTGVTSNEIVGSTTGTRQSVFTREGRSGVGQAIVFGLVASSALVIGGAVGAYWRAPERFTGVLLAFASGSMIASLSFELFAEAFEFGGPVRAGLGLVVGAVTFVIVNSVLDCYVVSV